MKLFRALAFMLVTAMPAAAQFVAKSIIFTHPGPYTQAQLESVVGMHAGTRFTSDELNNAAQRLADCGYFEDVGAPRVEGHANALSVFFDITPIGQAKMAQVGFENFVWLSPVEIADALHAKSPLYLGYLAENSPLADVFDAVLTDALKAKGITAKVEHDIVEPALRQPKSGLEFRITSPPVAVAHLKLAGVSPATAPLIQKTVNALTGAPYNEGLRDQTTEDRILAPLLDAGYIQASLADVTRTLTATDKGASIVLSATLNAGDVYHVSGIAFAGTPLLSADAFTATQKLHSGDLASRQLLLDTLGPLDAAYRRQGYMDVVVSATPAFEAATHQVAYTVTVEPGEQYRVNQVTVNNLDSAAQAAFDSSFTMKAGDLYSRENIEKLLAKIGGQQAFRRYTANFRAYADPSTHTVDLVISFFRTAAP